MNKRRSDAKLFSLTEEQQAELREWLLNGISYREAQLRVRAEFGVSVWPGAFAQFWADVCIPELLARRARTAAASEAVARSGQGTLNLFDSAIRAGLQQRVFETLMTPGSSPGDIKALYQLLLNVRQRDTQAGQYQLSREKFEFRAIKAAAEQRFSDPPDGWEKMNEAARLRAARLRLFGVLPKEPGEAPYEQPVFYDI